MSNDFTRRDLLKSSGFILGAGVLAPQLVFAEMSKPKPSSKEEPLVRLSLNENPYGPSPKVAQAVQLGLGRLNRYADAPLARQFAEQIAEYEHIPVEQVVLGEILDLLGLFLGSSGGPGGEFLYSTPGYLALLDAAAHVGGIGVPVPLNAQYQNDLVALKSRVNTKTRAIYLINPHNPTGTTNDSEGFTSFLRETSQRAVVVVDEAYLEYTSDFDTRSAASVVREGANVVVFRTFDKIHGVAGMPIDYVLAPRSLADALRKEGAGDAEGLGRLNLVAASAALADTAQAVSTREAVAKERTLWLSVLRELNLPHTDSRANFVFFDAGRPQPILAAAMRERGVDIGRAHPRQTRSPSGTADREDAIPPGTGPAVAGSCGTKATLFMGQDTNDLYPGSRMTSSLLPICPQRVLSKLDRAER
jgi:histidinol-phosphate aminotransferase